MSLSRGEDPAARAVALRDGLAARVAINHDERVTSAELGRAERAIALVFAAIVEDHSLRDALGRSATAGAAPRAELPLCRDVVLSLDTAIGLAAFHTDPND